MFAAIRTTARVKRQLLSLPSAPMTMWQARAARSTPSFSEHTSADSVSGSIGTTRSGKYTLFPRRRASRSSCDPGRT
jgi:hypothetical protein